MIEKTILTGIVVDESVEFTLGELSHACGMPAEWLLALVDEGVIEPSGGNPTQWRFGGVCLRRVRIVQRLECDLGVNLAGAALVLELLEEVEDLRRRVVAQS